MMVATKTATSKTYTELSSELQQVLTSLEQGDLDIDVAVKSYERGLAIVKELEALLKQAENRVTQLKESVVETIDEIEEE